MSQADYRTPDQEQASIDACKIVIELDDLIWTASIDGYRDPIRDAAIVARDVLLLALNQPPLRRIHGLGANMVEHGLPREPQEVARAVEAGPTLRKQLDDLVRTAQGTRDLTERRDLVRAVVREGYQLRALLGDPKHPSYPGGVEALRAFRDPPANDEPANGVGYETAPVPYLGAAWAAILHAHSERYPRELDAGLLERAIVAAAQEAERGGEKGQRGSLRAGVLNHLDALRDLLVAAGLPAPEKSLRLEYADARKRNANSRLAIAKHPAVSRVKAHEDATPPGSAR